MNQSLGEIECELGQIRHRLQQQQSSKGDTETNTRFLEVLDKYEQKISMFKMTGSQMLESTTENDRIFEFEKMRSDITTFRKELEAESELV